MQASILEFFQSIGNPFFDALFSAITMLGEQYFAIIVISYIYWNVSKKYGFMIAFSYIISVFANSLLKIAFNTQRPFQVLDTIEGKRLHTATGYAFPSGHTQGTASLWAAWASMVKRKWFWAIAISAALLVAVSRLYLGVHWPVDVLGGLFFGWIIAIPLFLFLDKIYDDKKKIKRFIISTLAIIFGSMSIFFVYLYTTESSLPDNTILKILGIILGFSAGFLLDLQTSVFEIQHKISIKLLRFLLGIITVVGLLVGLKALFPVHDFFTFLRYALVGFWLAYAFPFLAKKIRLFH